MSQLISMLLGIGGLAAIAIDAGPATAAGVLALFASLALYDGDSPSERP